MNNGAYANYADAYELCKLRCLSPTRSCRPLTGWRARAAAGGDARPLQYRDNRTSGVPYVFPHEKLCCLREVYASGGGLLVSP